MGIFWSIPLNRQYSQRSFSAFVRKPTCICMYLCMYVCFFLTCTFIGIIIAVVVFFLLFWFSSLCLDIFTVGPHCVSCIKGLNPAYWVRTTLAAACQTSQHVITATINRHTQRHTTLIQCSWNVLTHVCVLWHFIGSILFATRESLETFCFFAIALFMQRADWWLCHTAIKQGRRELVYATRTTTTATTGSSASMPID